MIHNYSDKKLTIYSDLDKCTNNVFDLKLWYISYDVIYAMVDPKQQ
jgi:hypothetical protein